jgi:hypothetical protein
MPIRNPRWPPPQDIRLTLDPIGKCSNAFFSETTNRIKAKLYMNVHWMVFYKLQVFFPDMKFKMAATAGFSLTLDPMENMFQNASSLKPAFEHFPIGSNVNLMSCGGGHLGFLIGIKN